MLNIEGSYTAVGGLVIAWGNLPDWISAAGSTFALLFGAYAVGVSYRTYAIQSRGERKAADDRLTQQTRLRQAQAALVSAWWGEVHSGQNGLYLRNASDNPVYQVSATVLSPDGAANSEKLDFPVLAPSKETAIRTVPICENDSASGTRRVTISFTDAAGTRWLRNKFGVLNEMPSTLSVKADETRKEMLNQFAGDFLASYGVTLGFEIDSPNYKQDQFVRDLRIGVVPDALVCPHDWIGSLVEHDALEPVLLSAQHRLAFPDWALRALTLEGNLYGLPTTVDTVALLRNTRLAQFVPTTFEAMLEQSDEIIAQCPEVTCRLAVRVGTDGDPFQIWPIFASAGGSLFGRTADGSWDPTRVEIGSADSIAAFEKLRQLGESGEGLLRRSMDRTDAIDAFTSGASPFLISTCDALPQASHSGIPFAVSAVPPFTHGMPAVALTLVHSVAVTRFGPNRATAHDLFADYLTNRSASKMMSATVSAPAALHGASNNDPAITAYLALCETGMAMPNFPQMEAVWRILEAAEVAVVSGLAAEPTAKDASARISALFERS